MHTVGTTGPGRAVAQANGESLRVPGAPILLTSPNLQWIWAKMANYHSAGKAIQLLVGPAIIRVCISYLEKRKRMRVTGLAKVNNDPTCGESRVNNDPTCGESRTSSHKSGQSSPKWSPGDLVPLQGFQNHQPKYTACHCLRTPQDTSCGSFISMSPAPVTMSGTWLTQ